MAQIKLTTKVRKDKSAKLFRTIGGLGLGILHWELRHNEKFFPLSDWGWDEVTCTLEGEMSAIELLIEHLEKGRS